MVNCGSPPPISAPDCDIRVVAVFSIIKTLTSQAMPEILRQEMYLFRDVVDPVLVCYRHEQKHDNL